MDLGGVADFGATLGGSWPFLFGASLGAWDFPGFGFTSGGVLVADSARGFGAGLGAACPLLFTFGFSATGGPCFLALDESVSLEG